MSPEGIAATLIGPVMAFLGVALGRKQQQASVKQTQASVEQTLANASATAVSTMRAVLESSEKTREIERVDFLHRITVAEETAAVSRAHFTKCEADLAICLNDINLLKLRVKELERNLVALQGDGK